MKLKTIWSVGMGMSIRERLYQTSELVNIKIAYALPDRIRYWVTIQEISRTTINESNIPATPIERVIQRLGS